MRHDVINYRKRAYKAPSDKTVQAVTLRKISDHVKRRQYAEALTESSRALRDPALSAPDQGRVLALVADSEFRRGIYKKAAEIYVQAAQRSLSHHELWLRPLIGHIRALLRVPSVKQAHLMARHTLDMALRKMQLFDEAVQKANQQWTEGYVVGVPHLPPRASVVATRLGYLFLQEGEPELAKYYFKQAHEINPRGGCRALQGLAWVALAEDDPESALDWAIESLRRGKYGAKTLSSWSILIAARHKLGGWKIKERLIDGLQQVPDSVRARAILLIVTELRKHDMRQWKEVAQRWSEQEGSRFPAIETEIRKMMLASWRAMPEAIDEKREAAEEMLRMPGLSPSEYRSAAKEFVRSSLWSKQSVDIEGLIREARRRYGAGVAVRVAHSLALSCMMAKRHDLARSILQRTAKECARNDDIRGKTLWALARMENLQGRHQAAASLYAQIVDDEEIPLRFRLQARLLRCQALIAAGNSTAIKQAKTQLMETLREVQDPVLLMNFARQVVVSAPDLEDWGIDLFDTGAALALQQFEQATHPSVAINILFQLTRRQVYDFGRHEDVIHYWEGLSADKQDWLWSKKANFWEYLGLVLDAYLRCSRIDEASRFAYGWINDSATPAEGRVQIVAIYGQWLAQRSMLQEALPLFERVTLECPTHPLSAYAWYWKALVAQRQGNLVERDQCVLRIRQAQGTTPELQGAWQLDAKALLLYADLQVDRIDVQAATYTREQLIQLCTEINLEMASLQ